LQTLLIDAARARPQARFCVAGPLYPADIEWPANVERIEHVPPAEHARFYGQSRLTLNVTREDMRRLGHSPSVRIFEAAACGAAILSDDWRGLSEILEAPREILIGARTADTLAALDLSDAMLHAIGAAARTRILASHTATIRADCLLSLTRKVLAPQRAGAEAGA
jgi:spore maturation protein CgeB